MRIRCDELDPIIAKRVKQFFLDKKAFAKMVRDAVEKRQTELPAIDARIGHVKKQIAEIEKTESDLQSKLLDGSKRNEPNFMQWLEGQIETLMKNKKRLFDDAETLESYRKDLLNKVGLTESLEGLLWEFVGEFDGLSGTERRNLLGRIVKRIVVKKGNKLDIEIYGQGPLGPLSRRKKSTGSEINWGPKPVDNIKTKTPLFLRA